MEEMMRCNRRFVESGEYKNYTASKYPSKKTAVVSCMDTRLVELLDKALGLKQGDVKMIKNAGGLVSDPYSDSMRSILIAVYELKVENVMIIAHTGCGVEGLTANAMYTLMEKRGIEPEIIEKIKKSGVDLDKWLTGFDETDEAVRKSVKLVAEHPLLPKGISVSGYVIDTVTGELRPV